jgi:hypothetical protein
LIEWEQTFRADMIFVVPIAVCLAIGIAVRHPPARMIAAGGAANTGFGQKHTIDESSVLPMIFVMFSVTISGFFGVLIGHLPNISSPSAKLRLTLGRNGPFVYGLLPTLETHERIA